jgi:hypothetical protein
LQENENDYGFVADTYVWDKMNGQVFELLDNGEARDGIFRVA